MTEPPYRRSEGELVFELSQDALDAAAAHAAEGVDGVSVASNRVRRPRGSGAVVSIVADRVRVSLEVACRFGVVLPAAGRAVQTAVAVALGELTGLAVERVDVEVVAVTRS